MSAQHENCDISRLYLVSSFFERSVDCQTVCDRSYENREEIVVYQHNAATLFKGKHTIFELTHMLKAASCRPYCLNDWQA
jgi:hypothetical protein